MGCDQLCAPIGGVIANKKNINKYYNTINKRGAIKQKHVLILD